jgi:hypothetical protein
VASSPARSISLTTEAARVRAFRVFDGDVRSVCRHALGDSSAKRVLLVFPHEGPVHETRSGMLPYFRDLTGQPQQREAVASSEVAAQFLVTDQGRCFWGLHIRIASAA